MNDKTDIIPLVDTDQGSVSYEFTSEQEKYILTKLLQYTQENGLTNNKENFTNVLIIIKQALIDGSNGSLANLSKPNALDEVYRSGLEIRNRKISRARQIINDFKSGAIDSKDLGIPNVLIEVCKSEIVDATSLLKNAQELISQFDKHSEIIRKASEQIFVQESSLMFEDIQPEIPQDFYKLENQARLIRGEVLRSLAELSIFVLDNPALFNTQMEIPTNVGEWKSTIEEMLLLQKIGPLGVDQEIYGEISIIFQVFDSFGLINRQDSSRHVDAELVKIICKKIFSEEKYPTNLENIVKEFILQMTDSSHSAHLVQSQEILHPIQAFKREFTIQNIFSDLPWFGLFYKIENFVFELNKLTNETPKHLSLWGYAERISDYDIPNPVALRNGRVALRMMYRKGITPSHNDEILQSTKLHRIEDKITHALKAWQIFLDPSKLVSFQKYMNDHVQRVEHELEELGSIDGMGELVKKIETNILTLTDLRADRIIRAQIQKTERTAEDIARIFIEKDLEKSNRQKYYLEKDESLATLLIENLLGESRDLKFISDNILSLTSYVEDEYREYLRYMVVSLNTNQTDSGLVQNLVSFISNNILGAISQKIDGKKTQIQNIENLLKDEQVLVQDTLFQSYVSQIRPRMLPKRILNCSEQFQDRLNEAILDKQFLDDLSFVVRRLKIGQSNWNNLDEILQHVGLIIQANTERLEQDNVKRILRRKDQEKAEQRIVELKKVQEAYNRLLRREPRENEIIEFNLMGQYTIKEFIKHSRSVILNSNRLMSIRNGGVGQDNLQRIFKSKYRPRRIIEKFESLLKYRSQYNSIASNLEDREEVFIKTMIDLGFAKPISNIEF